MDAFADSTVVASFEDADLEFAKVLMLDHASLLVSKRSLDGSTCSLDGSTWTSVWSIVGVLCSFGVDAAELILAVDAFVAAMREPVTLAGMSATTECRSVTW